MVYPSGSFCIITKIYTFLTHNQVPKLNMFDTTPNTTCPMCGSQFECGNKAGKKSCWCFELPPLKVEGVPEGNCLCFTCLQKYGKPNPTKTTE